jgi:radical SAM protein with 4Fe4S-binding SPASM domain
MAGCVIFCDIRVGDGEGGEVIGFTKLLCGTATVKEALKHAGKPGKAPAGMLRFVKTRGPLVVWNVTRQCNLKCKHCYYPSGKKTKRRELTRAEGAQLIADLGSAGVPVLLFSGGEPLLRKEVFSWGEAAKKAGMHPVLSTNGTLITEQVARRLLDSGFAYVGVSLDGVQRAHDRFRGEPGSYEKTLGGLRTARDAGLATGVRFTVCSENVSELPGLLDVVEREGIPRFCLYHLVYAGRGAGLARRDLKPEERRRMTDFLIEKTLDWHRRGIRSEILTVDNHADGVYIADYVRKNLPHRHEEVKQLIGMQGGCSAGTKFVSIDSEGNVHPCQFWEHESLGNVTECTFGEIWRDVSHPLLLGLRKKAACLSGSRCGTCVYRCVCTGCRVRAQAVSGDPWADDPACYLTRAEISARNAGTQSSRGAGAPGRGRAAHVQSGRHKKRS